MVRFALRTRRRMLTVLNVALAVVIVAAVAYAAVLPPSPDPPRRAQRVASRPASQPSAAALKPLGDYAVIYARDLRRPLFDPEVAAPAVPKRPELSFKLVGVVVEPGFTYGIFRTRSGRDKLASVGQEVEGAEVLAVEQGAAKVRFHDETITLTVAGKGAGG